jgi:hypothetical protein
MKSPDLGDEPPEHRSKRRKGPKLKPQDSVGLVPCGGASLVQKAAFTCETRKPTQTPSRLPKLPQIGLQEGPLSPTRFFGSAPKWRNFP